MSESVLIYRGDAPYSEVVAVAFHLAKSVTYEIRLKAPLAPTL